MKQNRSSSDSHISPTVRIDLLLFLDMIAYIKKHPDPSDQQYQSICAKAKTKLQSMINHELYTAAKTATTDDEKARLLQKYLAEREK
ncbi:hypothetical protein [Paenibacillus sp.]